MPRRSVLFSPGDQPDLLRKAPTSDADVVVFDLEDAVVPDRKDEARRAVTTVLEELHADSERDDETATAEICVRINPLADGGEADLRAVCKLDRLPDSIMLPKVGRASDIENLETALGKQLGDGQPSTTPPVLALLETASGILNAPAIADLPATSAVLFGAEDLSADIGATRTEEGFEVAYARQRTVLAAAHGDVDAIDTLYTDFEDTDGLAADVDRGRTLGFDGKMAIHPAQVSVINDGFTPDDEEREWARRVIRAKKAADENDRGVFAVDGEMIDAPLIKRAESILERCGIDPGNLDAAE